MPVFRVLARDYRDIVVKESSLIICDDKRTAEKLFLRELTDAEKNEYLDLECIDLTSYEI